MAAEAAVVLLDSAVGEQSGGMPGTAWTLSARQTQQESFMIDQSKSAPIGQRKYYTLEIDFNLASKPVRHWVNETEQLKGFRGDPSKPFCGIKFSEQPKISYDRKGRRGVPPDADPIALNCIWLVSDRLKQLLERLDPEAFVFQQAKVDYSNFPEPGPGRWFFYIMRTLDCVDEEHSVIRYQDRYPGIKAYAALIDVRMRPEVVGSAHAFRLTYADDKLIVDDVIVDALRAEKISGFEFEPIQK